MSKSILRSSTSSEPESDIPFTLNEISAWFGPFQVDWDYENETAPFLGMFGLPASARLLDESGCEKMQP